MKSLVTGGTGFLGTALCRRLEAQTLRGIADAVEMLELDCAGHVLRVV